MNSEQFIQALEDHFAVLNKLVQQGLSEAANVHKETLKNFTWYSGHLQSPLEETPDSKEDIEKKRVLHQANLKTCNSAFTSISDDTPITIMVSDIKKKHLDLLERIPIQVPFEYPQSTYQVRAKQLYQHFLFPRYLQRLYELILETRKELTRSLSELLYQEGQTAPEVTWEKSFKTLLGGFFREQREALEDLLEKSGKSYSLKEWKKKNPKGGPTSGLSQLDQAERYWRSTFYALYEDLRFREHLLTFIQEVRLLKHEVSSIISGRIQTTLYPELDKQKEITDRILDQLPDPEKTNMEELKSYLVKELYQLNKDKKMHSQETSTLEAAEGIPGILQKLESVIIEQLDAFPPKTGVVKAPDYETGIKSSEISYFSPREFLEYSSLARFLSVHKQLQADLAKVLEKVVREFKEFDQIIDFYLDSAIALTQKPGMKEEDVIRIFREGISRLEGIGAKSREMLVLLEQEKWAEISANTDALLDSVRELDDNDNIINIYTSLLKSKALAASLENRKRLSSGLKKSASRISGSVSSRFNWLKTSYGDIRKRLKLTSSSAGITPEISNYLTGVRKRITQLPVIYQHLFESAPVKELNLFLRREQDTAKLDLALADWEKGNYGATLVSGELGSGISSLLQYYAKSLKSKYPIISYELTRFYSQAEDFYSLLGEIFDQKDIADDDSLEKFVSGLTEKIVIVDGLERMFMRKVNGFECLRRFLALVVDSSHKIFWICSASKLAFQYLNRTVALSENFDYILDIDNLAGSDIRDIIMKRNRLSGYDIKFINSTEESDDQPGMGQEELEEIFFTDLERVAGSNIRLSLIYWLQSVQSVGEEGIKVSKFIVPDFDFFDNLAASKAYVLLLVVMHGKISVDYLAQASNNSLEESSRLLSVLKEDSILVRRGDYFHLNGILYRHVVKLLKDRNLIH